MKVYPHIQEAYIIRNADILREFARLQDKGKTTREIYPIISSNMEVTRGLIHALVYTPGYPYREEAQNVIKEELAENEKQGLDVSPALVKLVGYEPQLASNVPN